jgi:hypothetical protein
MMLSVDEIIKSIAQLPAAEQKRICRWLEDQGATTEKYTAHKHTLTVRQSRSDGCTKTGKSTQGNGSHSMVIA